jgi:chromosome segregation ATPase
MDVQFINSYNEVLFDNFVSVLKQNILFQTNIKILEEKVKGYSNLEQNLNELNDIRNMYNTALDNIDKLQAQLNQKDQQLSSMHSNDAEKYRLQSAVNDLMRQNAELEAKLNKKITKKKTTANNSIVAVLEEQKVESSGGTF